MFKKDTVLEIGEDYLIRYDYGRKTEHNLKLYEQLNVKLKRKKIYIILDEEDLNIRFFTIPKVKNKEIYDLIKNELFYYYRDIKNLIFAYKILKENKDTKEVIVLCLNTNKLNKIDKHVHSSSIIKGVYLLQLSVLNYFKKKIKDENYIFIFMYKESLYLLCSINSNIIFSSVIKNPFYEDSYKKQIYDFIDKANNYKSSITINQIFFANCAKNSEIESFLNELNCKNLGCLKEKKLVRNIIAKGRWV